MASTPQRISSGHGRQLMMPSVIPICEDDNALLNTQCTCNLELRWQTEVSSSTYATPLIADINRSEETTPLFFDYIYLVSQCSMRIVELYKRRCMCLVQQNKSKGENHLIYILNLLVWDKKKKQKETQTGKRGKQTEKKKKIKRE
ncbi:uncharacterized protein LOC120013149 isoform X1 [Tripterygium wilfordii]|uniref:uncharacterized protein LOC120013149 isoform X1 n=1 Tax=Tripterygium wilfordii TaxID=458696 RepID=UPI0018F80380|nr:uncharacterized protein LOC120013149 isoform X1 [Tripterygium wilfordii]